MRLALALAAVLASPAHAQDRIEVDVELLLMVDVSRSMSLDEIGIQKQGYAAAFQSDAVLGAVAEGMIGRIAVSYVEWAGAGSERVVIDWALIDGRETAEAMAETLLASSAYTFSRTSITSALDWGMTSLETNQFSGLRRVIDISGDGPNNQGGPVVQARDAALLRGIVINGLPLMTRDGRYDGWSVEALDRYYSACVTGGPGAFVLPVYDWEDFAEAVERKLVLEIAGRSPDPGEATVIPVQAEAPYDCLIGEKIWQQRRGNFDFR